MADTITVVCPKCKKQLKGPPEVQGKKVRCKSCGENFVAQPQAGAKPAAPARPGAPARPAAPAKTAKPVAAPAKSKPTAPAAAASKPAGDDIIALKPSDSVRVPPKEKAAEPAHAHEGTGDMPYQLTPASEGVKRCPQCAFEMDEEDIICLECGFNSQTRTRVTTRKTVEITSSDRLMWIMPGILCAIVCFVMLGFATFLWFLPDDEWYGHFSVKLWGSIIASFVAFLTGRFAFKRLVQHPTPPEIEVG